MTNNPLFLVYGVLLLGLTGFVRGASDDACFSVALGREYTRTLDGFLGERPRTARRFKFGG